jgi:hypothetical protein
MLKDKLQILQNRAARVITEARCDDRIRSSDLLEGLGWDNLQVRQAKLKSILMYKILNENCSPCLRESLVRLRELNRGHNLRNQETDLALPKPKAIFLKRSFKYRIRAQSIFFIFFLFLFFFIFLFSFAN